MRNLGIYFKQMKPNIQNQTPLILEKSRTGKIFFKVKLKADDVEWESRYFIMEGFLIESFDGINIAYSKRPP